MIKPLCLTLSSVRDLLLLLPIQYILGWSKIRWSWSGWFQVVTAMRPWQAVFISSSVRRRSLHKEVVGAPDERGDDKATVLWSVGTTGTGTTGARCIVLECGPRKGKLLKASEHECIQRTLCVDFVCNLVPRNFCIALGVNTLSHRASVLQQTLTVILHLYRWHLYLLDMYAWIYVSNHNMLMRFSNIFVKVKSQYTKQLTPNPSHLMSTTTCSFHFGVNCPFTQNISMPFFETTNSMVSL